MNKTIEALLRGYILFDVNGEKFFLYNSALEKKKSMSAPCIKFKGLHIFKGWRMFYLKGGPTVVYENTIKFR